MPLSSSGTPPSAPAAFEAELETCFQPDLEQGIEIRDASRMDGLNKVPALVRDGRPEQALDILHNMENLHRDFEFIYTWKAHIFQKKGDFDAARQCLAEGLENATTKHQVCDRMGFLESEAGNMDLAVQWWIKSIVLMYRKKRFILWEPFLYLSHVAGVIGRKKEQQILINAANTICQPGEVELQAAASEKLSEQSAGLKGTWLESAIQHLCLTCLKEDRIRPSSHAQNTDTVPFPSKKKAVPLSAHQGDVNRVFSRKLTVLGVFVILTAIAIFIIVSLLKQPDLPAPAPPTKKNMPHTASEPASKAAPTVRHERTKVSPEKPSTENKVENPRPLEQKTRPPYMKHKTKQPETGLKKKTPSSL